MSKHERPQPETNKTPEQPEAAPEAAGEAEPVAPIDEEGAWSEATRLEQELRELKAKYQRLGADYANYQKRTQRQIEQTREFTQEGFAKALLPVLDNFQHTLEKGVEAQDVGAVLQGVHIVQDHLNNVLSGMGMERIEVKPGAAFDPARHEAVMHEPTDAFDPNHVVRELAAGYTMNERTLRPAKVSVAQPAPEPETTDHEPGDDAEAGSED